MNREYVLIGVEGNHDQAFISKVLCKLLGFSEFKGDELNLDRFWRKFIPTYPKGGNLYKRLDMPTILDTKTLSIALYAGEGSNFITNLSDKLSDIDYSTLLAFGIIADADKNRPEQVAEKYHNGFKEYFPNFPTTVTTIGNVIEGLPRLGIYVLPDNFQPGVLDTLICDCGDLVYPEYMQRAREYIAKFSEEERKKKPLQWKPFDQEKAIIATVVSVLKPGKTNQTSISDNGWVSAETEAKIPAINNLTNFFRNLLNLKTE
ncbi:DUF3226 domain-containing protein [Anabaena cylindrica UHCC 0172]|uniref:DUF3226 domain-containing protein n=1 Tax=Anabaena cylindrica TaxID=1165 RepID=UPI002B215AD7|nr:DUF3226 domain-containing protein [Anabaena cylindrica]MEA5554275.1 DUF3226 domain-containing protein [Anabaena cylindrica UHCC 0172]